MIQAVIRCETHGGFLYVIFIWKKETYMNKTFEKLAAYFASMTADKASKREIEWAVNDANQVGLYLILLISIVLIMEASAWFILPAIALVLVWNWAMRKTRIMVLCMLYPSGDDDDDKLDDAMAQIGEAISLLSTSLNGKQGS